MNTKRIIALLLAIVMLFSLAACSLPGSSDDCKDNHVDENGDGKCDVCEKDMPNDDDDDDDDGNDGDDSYLAPTISEAIWAQLEAANSMKIDLSFGFDYTYDGYEDSYDDNEQLVIEKYDDKEKMDAALSMIISKTENGFNAMITLTATEYEEDEDGNFTPKETTETVYIVDGSAYNYDYDLEAYVETMMPSASYINNLLPAAVSEMLASMLEDLKISDTDAEAIKAEIGKTITAIFEIIDKKGDFNLDFKPHIDELFTYIKDLDLSTKTLESLIDDVLHLADEELSIAALLDEIKSLASLTVAEAMAELDAWLTENYETTIQGVYDTIVADERVEQIVRLYLESMGNEFGEPITNADVQALLDELRAIKVDEFIAAYVDTNTVLYDFIMTLVMSMGGADEAPEQPELNPNYPGGSDAMPLSDELEDEGELLYPQINTLFGIIEDYLDNTLQYIDHDIGYFFYNLKDALAGITINALNTSSNISFTDSFALSDLSLTASADVATEYPYGMDPTKTEKTKIKLGYSFKISDISDSTVEITLPANINTVFGIFNIEDYFSDVDSMYGLDLYWPKDADMDGVFTMNGDLVVDGQYISISTVMPTERQDTYEFDYVNYDSYSTGKLSITFDYDSFTYAVQFIN